MYYSPNRVLGLRILVLSHKSQNTWSRDSQMQIMRQPRFWSLPISTGNSKYILRLIKSHFSYSCYRTEILLQAISANVTIIITEFYFFFYLINLPRKAGDNTIEHWVPYKVYHPKFEMIVYINVEYWKERECQHSCWLFGKLLYDIF